MIDDAVPGASSLRVLHVDSAPSWRGGQNQVLLSAAGMARLGHDVTLVCRRGGALAERARRAGLDVAEVSFRGGDVAPGSALSLARLIRAKRPDVLHMHDPHAIAVGLMARLLAGSGAATIATRRVDFRVRGMLSRLKYRSCGRVVAVSQAIVDVLVADGVPGQQIRLVHEGVQERDPLPGGADALRQLGVPEGAPVVGVVAALTGHKDHETLLAAARLVIAQRPEAYFVLAGDGELRAALEAQAAELGIAAQCIFAGFRNDLDRLMPAFSVFCLSSRLEGLGTSLLDAMCFRRAVVVTAAGGIPEVVVDGVTGRVVPVRDPHALAEALLEVLADPIRQDRMGAAGRRRFEERFSAERMLEGTLAVYHGLL